MPDRYYSAEPIEGSTTTLDGSEAHHLLHVMRAKPGLELIVFDGQGGQFDAQVTNCQRSTVELSVGQRQDVERELPFELTLAVALPKGDRQRWLVEKCVELGVTRLIPLQTARSVGKNEKTNKLIRYIIEASKQCGRNRLMEIGEPVSWPALLADKDVGQRLIAHPGGKPLSAFDGLANDQNLILAVGPEGGFTDAELAPAVDVGWQAVGLGERILRIETAAVSLVAAITL